MPNSRDAIDLAEMLAVLQRLQEMLGTMADAMSPGGAADGNSLFDGMSEAVKECIKIGKRVDSPDMFSVYINAEGKLRAGCETRETDLTTDEIKLIKNFGRF